MEGGTYFFWISKFFVRSESFKFLFRESFGTKFWVSKQKFEFSLDCYDRFVLQHGQILGNCNNSILGLEVMLIANENSYPRKMSLNYFQIFIYTQ